MFWDRNVEIISKNRWKITGGFTIASIIHSYVTEIALTNNHYTAIATIPSGETTDNVPFE